MKTKATKALALLLAVIMCVGMLPTVAFAAGGGSLMTFEKNGSAPGTYTIYQDGGADTRLYVGSSGALATGGYQVDANCSWTITADENGNATIQNVGRQRYLIFDSVAGKFTAATEVSDTAKIVLYDDKGVKLTALPEGDSFKAYLVNVDGDKTFAYSTPATAGDFTEMYAKITMEPTAVSLTYNGSAQALVTAGTAENGTMKYMVAYDKPAADDAGWSDDIPEATKAGEYRVWRMAKGNTGYFDSDAILVAAAIAKRPVTAELYNVTIAKGTNYPAGFKFMNGAEEVTDTAALPAGEYQLLPKIDSANEVLTEQSDKEAKLIVLDPIAETAIVIDDGKDGITLVAGQDGVIDYSEAPQIVDGASSHPDFSIVVLEDESKMESADLAAVKTAMQGKAGNGKNPYLVEVNFYLNNAGVLTYVDGAKLNKQLTVTVPFGGAVSGKEYDVYHWNGSTLETVATGVVCTTTGKLTFTTDSFSPFVIVGAVKYWNVSYTVSPEGSATVLPSNPTGAAEGVNYTFKVKVAPGYELSEVYFNDVSQTVPTADGEDNYNFTIPAVNAERRLKSSAP